MVEEAYRCAGLRQAKSAIGAVAQLGEHLLCKQGVVGSIPISSTNTVLDSAHTEITIGPTLRLG